MSDPEVAPKHPSWADIGLVAAGGSVGTGTRYLVGLWAPTWGGMPAATLAINVVGTFLLAALRELLGGRGVDAGWSRRVRLAVGTGALGGFTTYSALAGDTVMLAASHPGVAAGYAAATVLLGAVASAAGIAVSRRRLGPGASTATEGAYEPLAAPRREAAGD